MNKLKRTILFLILGGVLLTFTRAYVLAAPPPELPRPIEIVPMTETLEERFNRKITLDVRDMSVVDVIKFLAMKGEFNLVTSPNVDGRITLLLHNVSINDALDIVLISNNQAYYVENNIVHVLPAVEFEALFGKRFNDKTEVYFTRLEYAKPSYVLAALDNIKSNVGKIIIDEDTGSLILIDTPEALAEMKMTLKDIEQPLETIVYTLQFARADVVTQQLRGRIDANSVGSISADDRSNRLIVRAYPGRKEEVESIIRSLDTPTKEVLIEARILQLSFKPTYDIGIDWEMDFLDSPYHNLQKVTFRNIFLDEDNPTSSDNLFTNFTKVGIGNIEEQHFEGHLRALQKISDTKILSSPKLLVTNRQEARIHIGDTVPYIISTTSGTGDNAITSEDVRFVDVGLKLFVTPDINEQGFVTMRLRPEISTVISTVESQGGGIPQVNKTEVETTVMVKDGTTIIMGGLRRNDKVHTRKGFPILMDVPFVGWMFGRTQDSIATTEIVILITPHIVTGEKSIAITEGGLKPVKEYTQQPKPEYTIHDAK